MSVSRKRGAGAKAKSASVKKQRQHQAAHALRIVSFNVHNGFEDAEEGKFTLDDTVAWLAQANVDVACFQEVTWRFKLTRHKLESLFREQLGFQFFAYGNADDLYGNGFYGQMTCSKLPIASTYSVLLERDPQENEARNALVTQICTKQSMVPLVTIVNTHLDAFDDSGATRLMQVKQILKYMAVHEAAGQPIILAGDFNAARVQDVEPKHRKEWDREGENEKTLTWLMQKGSAVDVFDRLGVYSGSSRAGDTWRIDFMWLVDKEPRITVRDARFASELNSSDHWPLIANLEFSYS